MNSTPSPIAIFFSFVGLLVASLLAAAALSPVVFHALETFPIHRVFNRIAMLVFLIGTIVLVRRLGVADRATLGFGVTATRQLRAALLGWAIGIGLLSLVAAVLFGLEVRAWKPEYAGALAPLLLLLPGALISGLVVGLIEESFFRGAMYGAIRQRGSVAAAVILTSLLYSAVHFLGERYRIPAGSVDWASGFVLLGKFFGAYARPLTFLDAFLALALVGALLAVVRERTGNIGMSIGLHAGFVTVIGVLRKSSEPIHGQTWSFLVGRHDGLVGWLVALMAAAALLIAIAWPVNQPQRAN